MGLILKENSSESSNFYLVVDDVKMNRMPLCNILKSLIIITDEEENGKEAIEKFTKMKKRK